MLITHLRAKVELRRQPDLRDSPAVIVDRSKGRPRVVDHFPAASGAAAGMTLEEALSRHAGAVVLEADEPSYQRVFRRTLTALQGVSDRVEGSDLGTAYARLDGLEALHGGEGRVVDALLAAVSRDLTPRVGVADAKFPAFVAARTSKALQAAGVPIDAAAFLAPYSIDLLPLSSDVKAAMRRFGLHAMGDIASMRRDLLLDQFGLAGRRAWDLCHGVDDSPVVPLAYEESIVEHVSLPFASASMELLTAAVDALLRRGYSRPRMRGRYAGRADLECVLYRASPWEKAFHFRQGVGSWEGASRTIRRLLEDDHPEAPVEELVLELAGLGEGKGEQMGLFPDVREGRERRLAEVERQLQERLDGGPALYRMAPIAPWHPAPEMRVLQVPLDPSGRDAMRPLALPTPVDVEEGPDGLPVAVRLERQWRRVARIEERWSFDLWWLPAPLSRAYYRVSREDGRQVTLFRDQREERWYQQAC